MGPHVRVADRRRRGRRSARRFPSSVVHTVQVGPDGTLRITYASRRDEATYRAAVDHTQITSDVRAPVAGS